MQSYLINSPHNGNVIYTEKPIIEHNEALIKICYCGICGSDLHAFEGCHVRRPTPLITGHEVSGIVEKIGTNDGSIKVGSKVTVFPEESCMICSNCMHGWTNLCKRKKLLGTNEWPGGFAEYIKAPISNVIELPATLPLELGALVEPVAVAIHALKQVNFEKGQNVIIFGMGSIGSVILTLCKMLKANQIVACDIKNFNLEFAKTQGADFAINISNGCDEAIKSINKLDIPELDVTLVSTSSVDAINIGFEITRSRGMIGLIGQFNKPGIIDIDISRIKEQSIKSSFTYVKEDFIDAVNIIEKENCNFKKLISNIIQFEEIDYYIKLMIESKLNTIKTLISFNKSEA
ncbi:MAG: alcohol dehydrogenase catalytic domain-containing protein [Desulfobulbaceae bacterium]|nr:alcohol dehydrogenase catalytic domain-containing protein [Desulfobulbaceae bacterium]